MDIRELAMQRSSFVGKMNDIQLFLSDKDYLTLEDKSPNFIYNKDNLSIDKKYMAFKRSFFNQLIVPDGHKSTVVLEDGTKIWIKAGSWLLYPVHINKRKIREIYVDGEIYLSVAHNKAIPFFVRTKDLNIKVTGTKFDVIAYSKESTSKVVLESGQVNVYLSGQKEIEAKRLFPGQMYCLSNGHKVSVKSVNAFSYSSWMNDIYDCNNTSLQEVIRQLERFYGKNIVCETDIAGLQCSGKLDLQKNLPSLLSVLTEVLSIHYHVREGVYYVSK